MIYRDITPKLLSAASQSPAITLTGPRQGGKTTLCRALFPQHPYVTVEAPDMRAFATEDPRGFLAQYPEGAVIDEVQRAPELLSYLQGIIDDDPAPGRWILTGSQNLLLLASVSQSLAGRTAVHHLLPLTLGEIRRFTPHPETLDNQLYWGGYPRIYDRAQDPAEWLRSYVATYLERDVRTIGNIGDLRTFQRFVELCAGRTGQLLNYSSLANDCGVSQPTAKAWLNILEASFIAFRLPAFHANLRKRLVKMPKLYFYDSGLTCWLLGIRTPEQLRAHPLRGPIFETWVVSEVMKHRFNEGAAPGLSFYRDKNGAEVDLVFERAQDIALMEVKSSATPAAGLFDSAKRVLRHLAGQSRPCHMAVVYGGDEFQQRFAGKIVPWNMLRMASLPDTPGSVRVTARGQPVAGVEVLALFPNGTWNAARTSEVGEATLNLHSVHLPMTIYAAGPGFAAFLHRGWLPAESALHIEMQPISNGGSVIFKEGTGYIPGLAGRLNPKRDALGRTWLYAGNVAIDGGLNQPVAFEFGQELQLTDAGGSSMLANILLIVGRSALIQYRRIAE